MKGALVLIGIVAVLLGYTQLDRLFGPRLRDLYDRREKVLFPSLFVSFFGVAAVLAFVLNGPKLQLGFTVGYFALMTLGLNIVVGYAGLLDLGYVAFFAIGAYTMAIFTNSGPLHVPWHLNFWEILPIGIAIALLSGVLLGAPTLRLRGDYLAIVTLGFGEIVRRLAENLEGVTRGAKGITDIPHPAFLGTNFGVDVRPYYLVVLACIALSVFVVRRLNNSRVGRAWAAIREDEIAAEAMGVPTLKYKLAAFAIGASTASLGGMVFASQIAFVSPEQFQLLISIFILSGVVLGGIGSIAGALVGSVVVNVVPEMLRSLPDRLLQARFGVFGLALVLMMIFRPQGLVPSRRRTAELKGGSREMKGPLGAMPAGVEPERGDPDAAS